MSTDQIRPVMVETLAAGPGWCVTFTDAADPAKWLQYTDGLINAAFPHADDPVARLAAVGQIGISAWQAGLYVEGLIDLTAPGDIARWIDGYFRTVLGSAEPYVLESKLERR